MDEKYWNTVGQDYDDEIFCALANDRNDVIASKISQFGSKGSAACDFGCGVGKFLPILAANFGCVHAVDISSVCLDQARESCPEFENISYSKIDLCAGSSKLRKVHFGLSVNVAIMQSEEKRSAIFDTVGKYLHRGGRLLLIVPSLESALYADFRLIQWNRKAGLRGGEVFLEMIEADADSLALRLGLVEINEVPTKHYLEEELRAIFERRPFDVVSIEKVEYPWTTEFDRPPKWMKEPYPWDWLAVLKKT